jgi:hypothetical protein
MLKLLSTLEIPVLDKPPKLLILVTLQQIPKVTMRSHEKKTGREQRSVGSVIGAPTPAKSGGEGEETDEGWR